MRYHVSCTDLTVWPSLLSLLVTLQLTLSLLFSFCTLLHSSLSLLYYYYYYTPSSRLQPIPPVAYWTFTISLTNQQPAKGGRCSWQSRITISTRGGPSVLTPCRSIPDLCANANWGAGYTATRYEMISPRREAILWLVLVLMVVVPAAAADDDDDGREDMVVQCSSSNSIRVAPKRGCKTGDSAPCWQKYSLLLLSVLEAALLSCLDCDGGGGVTWRIHCHVKNGKIRDNPANSYGWWISCKLRRHPVATCSGDKVGEGWCGKFCNVSSAWIQSLLLLFGGVLPDVLPSSRWLLWATKAKRGRVTPCEVERTLIRVTRTQRRTIALALEGEYLASNAKSVDVNFL